MNRKTLSALILVAVLGLSLWTLGLPAQQAANEAKAPAFAGKVIFVQGQEAISGVFENPEIRTLGSRSFVVGKPIENKFTRENITGGKEWIPLEEVHRIVEWESREAFEKHYGVK